MAKARLDEKVTVRGIIFLILTILGLFGLFLLMVNVGDDKVPATYEQVWNTLTEYECTPLDYTEHFSENYSELDFEYAISCRDNDLYVDFFQFSNVEDANIAYSMFNSVINKNFSRDAIETGGDMRNFTIRTYLYEGEYFYLMRVSNTVFYSRCLEPNKSLVNDIASSLGYYL